MAGIDAYTVLLLHCDGDNGSTSFPDATELNSPTVTGDTQVSTAQKKFGTGSVILDGNEGIVVPDSAYWNFGSGSFTIDCWLRPSNTSGVRNFYGQANVGITEYILGWIDGSYLKFGALASGAWITLISTPFEPTLYVWYHIAIVRDVNTWYLFINGDSKTISLQAGSYSNAMPDIANDLLIGNHPNNTNGFNGYIDEVRVSKGIARWTSNFTPPTSEYSSEITQTDDERAAKLTGEMFDERGVTTHGYDLTNDERAAKLTGGMFDERAAKTHGYDLANGERAAKLTGGMFDERAAKTEGYDITNDERPAKIEGTLLDTSDRNAKTHGYALISSERPAKTVGYELDNSERSAKTTGYVLSQVEREAKLHGYDLTNNGRSAKIVGYLVSSAERSSKLIGYRTEISQRNALITGTNNAIWTDVELNTTTYTKNTKPVSTYTRTAKPAATYEISTKPTTLYTRSPKVSSSYNKVAKIPIDE